MEGPGFLTNVNQTITQYEAKFVQTCAEYGLSQINHLTNSRLKFLDLILSTSIENIEIVSPEPSELMDRNSVNHNAIEARISYQLNELQDEFRIKNTYNLRLRQSKIDVHNHNFVQIDRSDINSESNVNIITEKIHETTNGLLTIQNNNTVRRSNNLPTGISTHAWAKDKIYRVLFRQKSSAKANFRILRSRQLRTKNFLEWRV